MGTRKLTAKQVRRIREIYDNPKSNYSQRDLARMYGVSRSTIYAVVHRHTYKSI